MAETTYGPVPPNPYFYPVHRRRQSSSAKSPTTRLSLIQMFVNAIYYPNWAVFKKQPPSSLHIDCVSHVFYAFARVQPDGTVYLSDDVDNKTEVDCVAGALRATTLIRRLPSGIPRVILSVGGGDKGSENFPVAASKPETRKRFAESARQLVLDYKLDGIDIDWERPNTPQEGQDLAELLAILRTYLPKPRFWLTTALHSAEWALKNIPLAKVAEHVNFINVMTYDFSGPWIPLSGHQAQLYSPEHPYNDASAVSCNSAVKYYLAQGVPANQIVLGIPAFGRSFLGATGPGQTYSGSAGDEGTFAYRDIPHTGVEERVDKALGAAYCVGKDVGFVSYDNPETVGMKARYAKLNGLAGLFYWTGPNDVYSGSRSLINVGFEELHSGR